MVSGRYNYSYWGLHWFINQQTSLGGPILYPNLLETYRSRLFQLAPVRAPSALRLHPRLRPDDTPKGQKAEVFMENIWGKTMFDWEYDWFFGISRRIFGSGWWANHGDVIHFSNVEGFDPSPYLKFWGSMINHSLVNRISHRVL